MRERIQFRRASNLLAYWKDGRLCFSNFASRLTIAAGPLACEVLDFFGTWRTSRQAVHHFSNFTPRSVRSAVSQLLKQGLLLRKGSPEAKDDERIAHAWGFWLPEASLHFWTKNAPYVRDESAAVRRIKDALLATPQPKIFKSVKGGDSFRLPSQNFPNSEFVRVLLGRKTHRHFRKQSLSLESVSRLLSLVWGVTGYIHSPRFGKLLRKTSPSGGGRHPGEVYLMALRVKGLRRGLYYYHPSHHRLDRISTPATPTRAWQYCARQQFVKNAAALFLMTAVFPRTIWKYRHPRAYRVVLLETGHLCQTFCLVATWLGLAPFCTAALNDLLIEKDLGIDGIHESVLYVAGVGYPNTAEHPAHSVNRALGHEHHHRRNLAFRIGERVTR